MLKANDGKQLEIEVESNKYCRMVDTNKNSGKKDYYNIKKSKSKNYTSTKKWKWWNKKKFRFIFI